METLLLETNTWQSRLDDAPLSVSPETLRLARSRCSDYFRSLGVRDPEVLARVSAALVQRSLEQIDCDDTAQIRSRLVLTTLDAADAYVQKWIVGIEKQIDLHGGISRCGEIALRLSTVLNQHPEAIESVEAAVVLFRQDKSLCMNAQPPNNPTRFAGQPLTASQRGIASELFSTVLKAISVWFPQQVRKHAS
ncbi:MAG: hypothetical protein ACO1RT_08235 [Planctomycetaceae bacterium]